MQINVDIMSCLFHVLDCRNEELLPNWKVPAFQTSKTNLKRLLLFYILCEEFRSYIGLHKFPGERKNLLCVYLLENKTIVFLLCNSSYNRCENKYT